MTSVYSWVNMRAKLFLGAALASGAMMTGNANAGTVLLNSYQLGQGCLNAAAFDAATDTVWAKPCFGNFRQYDRSGNLVSTVTDSAPSDDSDITIARVPVKIGNTTVPAGTILYGNGDAPGGPKLSAIDPVTGATLASISVPSFNGGGAFNGNMVGAAYSAARDTFFLMSWSLNRVMEFDAKTGTEVAEFSVNPLGAPSTYTIYYGDIEVDEATGNLLIVSSNNPDHRIRELTATGAFVQDIDLTGLGITGESGLALDQVRGEMWITSSDNGMLYRVGGFDAVSAAVPEPGTFALMALCLGGLAFTRRKVASV